MAGLTISRVATKHDAMSTSTVSEWVAGEVRAHIARQRITGVELAKRMGASQRYVSRRLKGDTPIDVDDLVRIADALDVPVTDLLPSTVRSGRDTAGYPAASEQRTSPDHAGPAEPTTPTDHAAHAYGLAAEPTGQLLALATRHPRLMAFDPQPAKL